ncbi:hypothetical protein AB0G54_17805 [Streptomyces yokosukanensis]|uniref:hypothetical protein n=1 Tax=Streptomyces yokosukanensis TaxID=67386 RepID=UPI00342AE505
MLLSSIVADPGDATLIATGISSFVVGGLGALTLTHHKQMLAWVQKVRRKEEDTAELVAPADDLEALYKEQCGLARTPCSAEDFAEVTRIVNMIRGREHTECIHDELDKVVKRADVYLDTALPKTPAAAKIPPVEVRAQMIRAMKQESARIELERAISTARQKINVLRRI